MKRKVALLGFLAAVSLAVPAIAQETAPPKPERMEMPQGWKANHPSRRHGGFIGYGCHLMMMDPGGMSAQGPAAGPGMAGGAGGPLDGLPAEMMRPGAGDSADMVQLKQEIKAQHEKLLADRTQMRADCQRMHELLLRHRELRAKNRKLEGPKSPTTKGNAAPKNPAHD